MSSQFCFVTALLYVVAVGVIAVVMAAAAAVVFVLLSLLPLCRCHDACIVNTRISLKYLFCLGMLDLFRFTWRRNSVGASLEYTKRTLQIREEVPEPAVTLVMNIPLIIFRPIGVSLVFLPLGGNRASLPLGDRTLRGGADCHPKRLQLACQGDGAHEVRYCIYRVQVNNHTSARSGKLLYLKCV